VSDSSLLQHLLDSARDNQKHLEKCLLSEVEARSIEKTESVLTAQVVEEKLDAAERSLHELEHRMKFVESEHEGRYGSNPPVP
jgi:hypothetical protein